MGSAESKVAAQPLVAVAPGVAGGGQGGPGRPPSRPLVSVVTCNLLKKQNRTAPAAPSASSASAPSLPTTPRSSPTIETVKEAKPPSLTKSASGNGGPSSQILTASKAVSLNQLTPEELSTQLLKAVKNGDQKLVERIAEIAAAKQQPIVNIRGMWESTPLIYACQYCHEGIALWLLRAGADVHLANEKGVTALLLASLEGMVAAVREIVAQSAGGAAPHDGLIPIDEQIGVVYNSVADVNVRANPLLAASMNGHVEVAKMLLASGALANCGVAAASASGSKSAPSASVRGSGGGGAPRQFPLLVAAKYGHTSVVELLISHGAGIAEVDDNDNHALLLACEAGQEDCAIALLRQLPPTEYAVWKRGNVHGFTALHYSAVQGLARAMEFMLIQLQWKDDAAFLNATSATRHECAVLMASRKKQLDVARLLLQCGADALLADRGATSAIDVLKRERRDELVQIWQDQQLKRQDVAGGTEQAGDGSGASSSAEVSAKSDEHGDSVATTAASTFEFAGDADSPFPLQPNVDGGEEEAKGQVPSNGTAAVSNALLSAPPTAAPNVQTTPTNEGSPAIVPAEKNDGMTSVVEKAPSTLDPLREKNAQREGVSISSMVSTHQVDGQSVHEQSSVSTSRDSLQEGNEDQDVEQHEQPTDDFTAMVAPQRSHSSRSKSNAQNRRPTGYMVEPQLKTKSFSKLVVPSTLMQETDEGQEDEFIHEEVERATTNVVYPQLEASTTLESRHHVDQPDERRVSVDVEDAPTHMPLSSAHPLSVGARIPLDQQTPSSAVDVGAQDTECVDESVSPVKPQSEDRKSSSSPRKEREKHKKKKRHSRKKASSEASASPTNTKDGSSPFLAVSTVADDDRGPSMRTDGIEDDQGRLDDDF